MMLFPQVAAFTIVARVAAAIMQPHSGKVIRQAPCTAARPCVDVYSV